MRTKKLTKRDRENLRSRKWLVFERSSLECTKIISELRQQATTIEQKKRLLELRKRIGNALGREAVMLGWQTADLPWVLPSQKRRTRLSIEA